MCWLDTLLFDGVVRSRFEEILNKLLNLFILTRYHYP